MVVDLSDVPLIQEEMWTARLHSVAQAELLNFWTLRALKK
jgi:hypothetical protein